MKTSPLLTLLLVLFLGACSDNGQINEPSATPDARLTVEANMASLELGLELATMIDDMPFQDADFALLLDPIRPDALNVILDGRIDGRAGIDLAAIAYYQLIMKANPDFGERIQQQLRELIAESNQRRQRILASDLSPERKRAALQEEHERLIAAMNRLIGEKALANVRALQERLAQHRQDRLDAWLTVQLQKLTQLLGLTERQQAAVKDILLLQQKQMLALTLQYKGSPEKLAMALRQLQQRVNMQIATLLTDRQLVIWKKYLSGGLTSDRG